MRARPGRFVSGALRTQATARRGAQRACNWARRVVSGGGGGGAQVAIVLGGRLSSDAVKVAVQLRGNGSAGDFLIHMAHSGGKNRTNVTVLLRRNLPPRMLLKSYVHALVRPSVRL
jgi:hypothetical protein